MSFRAAEEVELLARFEMRLREARIRLSLAESAGEQAGHPGGLRGDRTAGRGARDRAVKLLAASPMSLEVTAEPFPQRSDARRRAVGVREALLVSGLQRGGVRAIDQPRVAPRVQLQGSAVARRLSSGRRGRPRRRHSLRDGSSGRALSGSHNRGRSRRLRGNRRGASPMHADPRQRRRDRKILDLRVVCGNKVSRIGSISLLSPTTVNPFSFACFYTLPPSRKIVKKSSRSKKRKG